MSDNEERTDRYGGRYGYEPLPEGWGGRDTEGMPPGATGRRLHDYRQDGTELYAGGERSGLAVQNPNERDNARGIVEGILQQASAAPPPGEDHWTGVGHTLGSDERRVITFWADGFSIEDGPLHSYDDPETRELLQAIKAGRAPLSLFNVAFDQPLELEVQQRTGENYSPPPKAPPRAFSGEGNRLGSIVPTISGANTPVNRSSTQSPVPAQPTPAQPVPEIKLDADKPAANVQIRLADGSRTIARVNLDHTVADLRAFVAQSRPDPRQFVLQTTFPSRELKDDETIEGAKLANAVVVQRYT